MSKPINVEAQRVHKVIEETSAKLRILGLLNTEFFDEVRKKDENEVQNYFGQKVGQMLMRHAWLEEKFQTVCVEDGVKMTPLEDELISEEARQCAIDVQISINKLVRTFSNQEMQLKMKIPAYDQKSGEFSVFVDNFKNLHKLMTTKLNTQLEEVKAQQKSRKRLSSKTRKLQEIRDTKKENYDKTCEDCSKSKEIRDDQKKVLIGQISKENATREEQINESIETGAKSEDTLREQHQATMKGLEKNIKDLETQLTKVMKQNKEAELHLRKEYKKSSNAFQDNMNTYDFDMKNQTRENEKCQAEYDDAVADLDQMKESYSMLLDEKRKRDEIAAIMKKKNDEQNATMDKLVKASEFIQAHWRGMQERRLMEKAMKGKRKKGKKKKK